MNVIDLLIILSCVLIVCVVFGIYLYRKIKNKPTGDCACCGSKGNSLLKKYHKKYK